MVYDLSGKTVLVNFEFIYKHLNSKVDEDSFVLFEDTGKQARHESVQTRRLLCSCDVIALTWRLDLGYYFFFRDILRFISLDLLFFQNTIRYITYNDEEYKDKNGGEWFRENT